MKCVDKREFSSKDIGLQTNERSFRDGDLRRRGINGLSIDPLPFSAEYRSAPGAASRDIPKEPASPHGFLLLCDTQH